MVRDELTRKEKIEIEKAYAFLKKIRPYFKWVIVIAFALLIINNWGKKTAGDFYCPNEYPTAEDYLNGMTEWAVKELEKSPEMTQEEVLNKREKQFTEHNCEKSIWDQEVSYLLTPQ